MEPTTATIQTTVSMIKDEKKPDLTTILIAVLVPVAVVAIMIMGFIFYLKSRRKPHYRRRDSFGSYDEDYSYRPRLPINQSKKSSKHYGSGFEMRENQIVDDSDIED